MAYEEEIPSFKELLRELEILDADAGIRIEARYDGVESYIFITRSGQGFAMAVHTKMKNLVGPGRRVEFRHFSNLKQLTNHLSGTVKDPRRIFKY
ncbi:MAG: hypothetical protein JRN68_05465 [Nitrososphaerota archaeon]|jgi:hypothetical protein|nr:hypothetical protein [Nitrososphaerota archaeon]